jgi:hypothetical protein
LYRGTTDFSAEENTSLRTETSRTSRCLVTTQKPPSPKPPTSGGWAFHHSGAERLSSASSSTGNRWT